MEDVDATLEMATGAKIEFGKKSRLWGLAPRVRKALPKDLAAERTPFYKHENE